MGVMNKGAEVVQVGSVGDEEYGSAVRICLQEF